MLCFLSLVMASGCISGSHSSEVTSKIQEGQSQAVYVIENEDDIPPEYSAPLENKVIVLYSKYCSACKVAIPRLKNIEQELDMQFEYLDLSEESARQRIMELGIVPHYTPTVIANCKVLIGAYPEDVYKEAITQALKKSLEDE